MQNPQRAICQTPWHTVLLLKTKYLQALDHTASSPTSLEEHSLETHRLFSTIHAKTHCLIQSLLFLIHHLKLRYFLVWYLDDKCCWRDSTEDQEVVAGNNWKLEFSQVSVLTQFHWKDHGSLVRLRDTDESMFRSLSIVEWHACAVFFWGSWSNDLLFQSHLIILWVICWAF